MACGPGTLAPVTHTDPATMRGSHRYRMPLVDAVPSTAPLTDHGPMYPLTRVGLFAKSASVAGFTVAGANATSARFRSTSRSPGTPTTTILRVPFGAVSASTTFLRVSDACHGRSSRGCEALSYSTRVLIVEVFGVSTVCAAGSPTVGRAAGAWVKYASTFAAYPPSVRTKLSSPMGVGYRNSSLLEPPMAPASAWTMTYSSPSRVKMRSYATRCFW